MYIVTYDYIVKTRNGEKILSSNAVKKECVSVDELWKVFLNCLNDPHCANYNGPFPDEV